MGFLNAAMRPTITFYRETPIMISLPGAIVPISQMSKWGLLPASWVRDVNENQFVLYSAHEMIRAVISKPGSHFCPGENEASCISFYWGDDNKADIYNPITRSTNGAPRDTNILMCVHHIEHSPGNYITLLQSQTAVINDKLESKPYIIHHGKWGTTMIQGFSMKWQPNNTDGELTVIYDHQANGVWGLRWHCPKWDSCMYKECLANPTWVGLGPSLHEFTFHAQNTSGDRFVADLREAVKGSSINIGGRYCVDNIKEAAEYERNLGYMPLYKAGQMISTAFRFISNQFKPSA